MSASSLATIPAALPGQGWTLPVALPVAATVLAFILWWPLGLLALLLWKGATLMGCSFTRAGRFGAMERRARRMVEAASLGGTGNTAFDDHRAATLRRLEEERQALDEQQRAFGAFVQQLRRAKDREEFDRFMAERGGGGSSAA